MTRPTSLPLYLPTPPVLLSANRPDNASKARLVVPLHAFRGSPFAVLLPLSQCCSPTPWDIPAKTFPQACYPWVQQLAQGIHCRLRAFAIVRRPLPGRTPPMQFRPATLDDFDAVVAITTAGREFLASQGLDQWQGGNPSPERVREDIERGYDYLAVDETTGEPLGVVAFCGEAEPDYANVTSRRMAHGGPQRPCPALALRGAAPHGRGRGGAARGCGVVLAAEVPGPCPRARIRQRAGRHPPRQPAHAGVFCQERLHALLRHPDHEPHRAHQGARGLRDRAPAVESPGASRGCRRACGA